ncbi:SUMF1/EgtB/PvdO family nonheme iron enzyme [bacterium]|nr:SUMF1/EgtB/PvdO family nonheme iron enzyme [candidate division CSSED10-310 bacterium]
MRKVRKWNHACNGTSKKRDRVIRGGSWNNDADNCRSAYRNRRNPDNRNRNRGFRLVRGRRHSTPRYRRYRLRPDVPGRRDARSSNSVPPNERPGVPCS